MGKNQKSTYFLFGRYERLDHSIFTWGEYKNGTTILRATNGTWGWEFDFNQAWIWIGWKATLSFWECGNETTNCLTNLQFSMVLWKKRCYILLNKVSFLPFAHFALRSIKIEKLSEWNIEKPSHHTNCALNLTASGISQFVYLTVSCSPLFSCLTNVFIVYLGRLEIFRI